MQTLLVLLVVYNCASLDTVTGIEYDASAPDQATASFLADQKCTAAQSPEADHNPCVDLDCTEVTVTHE